MVNGVFKQANQSNSSLASMTNALRMLDSGRKKNHRVGEAVARYKEWN